MHFENFLIMFFTSLEIFGHHTNVLHGVGTSGLPGLHGHSPELTSVVGSTIYFFHRRKLSPTDGQITPEFQLA